MNSVNPVIWNINATLFQSEQRVKELTQKLARVEIQLAAEQKANKRLESALLDFVRKLRSYADSLPGASIAPKANGIE